MSQTKPGNVAFVMHHDSKLSRLIAWFMRSPWSHSALVSDVGSRDTWLCETTDMQIAFGSFNAYVQDSNCSIEVYEPIGVENDAILHGLKEAENNVGSLYAYWQLLSWSAVLLLERIGIKIANFLPYGWVCNSHVLDGIRHYPIAPFEKITQQSIHTGQMYDMMKSSPNWKLVYKKERDTTKNAH